MQPGEEEAEHQRSTGCVLGVLFVCNLSMFAQVSREPATQGASDADAQPHSFSDQDVEMLRADLRAQRKQIVAQNMNLTPRRGHQILAHL